MSLLSIASSSVSKALSKELPKAIEPKLKDFVNASLNQIPNEERMQELGKEVSALIIQFINENVLPSLYNRSIEYSTEMALKGVTFDESTVDKIYEKVTDIFPEKLSFDINNVGGKKDLDLKIKDVKFRKMVKSALTKEKLRDILKNKIAPFLDEIERTALPVVKRRVTNVAIMSVLVTATISSVATYFVLKGMRR